MPDKPKVIEIDGKKYRLVPSKVPAVVAEAIMVGKYLSQLINEPDLGNLYTVYADEIMKAYLRIAFPG